MLFGHKYKLKQQNQPTIMHINLQTDDFRPQHNNHQQHQQQIVA